MESVIELEAPYAPPAPASGISPRAFEWIRAFLRRKSERAQRSETPRSIVTSRPVAGRTLENLQKGESGTITKIHGTTSVRLHLMEMGLTPGTTITVGRVAVMGGPFDITVRGYRLSLRREEARAIELQSE